MSLDPKSICDIILTCWDRTAKYRKYIRSLGENLNILESKVYDLGCVYGDVKRLVETAEAEEWNRNSVVDGWLKKVETLEQEARLILADGKRIMERECLHGLCYWNCRPRYKQSCRAEDMKVDVGDELIQGQKFKVKEDVAYEPADLTLKRSVEALRGKMGELRDVFETVMQRVKREEAQHSVRTAEVAGWLKGVEGLLEKEVREVLEEGELEMEKSGQRVEGDSQCQRNFLLYHAISKRIDEKRAILEGKLIQGHSFTVVTGKPDHPLILEIPSERPIGAESVFEEIWNWVEDEKVRCIGLFGMGGVGKTTLLNRVHNQFLQVSHDYNFALRVVVSRPANLDRIQEAVLKELKLPNNEWSDLDRIRRASLVHNLMKEKNFLLFLDDLWDPIDLVKDIGIPYFHQHSKKCKIVFTTRDEGVCNRMHPDKKKKVECLPPDEALQLFRQKLGEETWGAHPLIPNFATSLVHECKYLPVALVTVAGAMAGTTELKDWMDAEKYLKSHLSKFSDMNERALANLEFSYKNLPDETHRLCFLYLSVFPEDHEIDEDDAINLWIGEGFLDECRGVHEARNYGGQIFRKLRHACLVESVTHSYSDGEIVKMHDVVREMALWVDSEHGLETDRVLVRENLLSFSLEEIKKWEKAKRISLWGRSCNSLANISCSNLSTLVIRATSLRTIPDDFFLSTPCLRVLVLSCILSLTDLPKSIWKLMNLRYLDLDIKPEGLRKHLHQGYNVSVTEMMLPTEIKNLKNLVVLILSYQFLFPDDALSNLSSLRVLSTRNSILNVPGEYERELLEQLHIMQSVEELSITLSSQEGVQTLLDYANLHDYLKELCLYNCHGLESFRISTSSLRRLEHLSSLALRCCDIRQVEITDEDKGSHRYSYVESLVPKGSSLASLDIFSSLRDVLIESCHNLLDVTSLICHAPILKILRISRCRSLKEVIVGDAESKDSTISGIFSCLEYLRLGYLESLERICSRALPFPSLKKIDVVECWKLKELPLNCESAKTLQLIKGEKAWWQGLEWDDPATKQVFSAKFVRRPKVSSRRPWVR